MIQTSTLPKRPSTLTGGYELRGSYRMTVSTGAVTLIAARTATAGFLFAFRWPDATRNCYLRYLGAKFVLTTAYTTAQETGCDLIVARAFTANTTGATAVDAGQTVTSTGEYRTVENVSLMGVAGLCRIADAGALTSGTHTLDANAMSILNGWSGAIGDTIPGVGSGAGNLAGVLWDARSDRMPLEFAQNEGFIVRNTILMGAVGVGRWDFTVEWDEGTPASQSASQ